MELAIIALLLLAIAFMGTVIVHLMKSNNRQKEHIERLKQSFTEALNSITNGRDFR